jgi:signal transduction histidine kinase
MQILRVWPKFLVLSWLAVSILSGAALNIALLPPPWPQRVGLGVATLAILAIVAALLPRHRHLWSQAAAQEERNRLARDLHDSIKQQLFSINLCVAAVDRRWEEDPAGARQVLQEVRRSLREVLVEMQAMLQQLQPVALASVGLIAALRDQCEALGYRTGAQVTFDPGPPIPDERLPLQAQEHLFRIAQEAFSNIARHARAQTVRVFLEVEEEPENGWVRLSIHDDGQGFSTDEPRSGMGLRHLQERARAIHGRLSLSSFPGNGTSVVVEVPLKGLSSKPADPLPKLSEALDRQRWGLVVDWFLLGGAVFHPYLGLIVMAYWAWGWFVHRFAEAPRRWQETPNRKQLGLLDTALRNTRLVRSLWALLVALHFLQETGYRWPVGALWLVLGLGWGAAGAYEVIELIRASRPRWQVPKLERSFPILGLCLTALGLVRIVPGPTPPLLIPGIQIEIRDGWWILAVGILFLLREPQPQETSE